MAPTRQDSETHARSASSNLPARQDASALDAAGRVMSVEFAGPLPPPGVLQGYDACLPGAANRILTMAEEQASHRRRLEQVVVEGGHKRANVGLWLGFAISLFALGLSAWVITQGYEVAGTIIGSLDVCSLAAVFVVGRVDQRRERVAKEKMRLQEEREQRP